MTEDALSYGNPPQLDFESQYKRIFEAAGCRTQVELAAFLNIRQSSVSDAKSRKAVPSDWLMTLFEKKRVNPDWVLTGQGSRYLRPADDDATTTIRITEIRPPEQSTAQELVTELVRRSLGLLR